jgi:hypothetical protein
MAFRYFNGSDFDRCKGGAIYSKGELGNKEKWDYIGSTDDEDWDLRFPYDSLLPFDLIFELSNSGKYVILRKYGEPLTPRNCITLKSNGEIKRGGERMKFRCVESVDKSYKRSPKASPMKKCASNQIRNPSTGRCVMRNGALGKQILRK